MQEIQTALDILSLLPIATAAILLLAHLWGCWQRTAPSQPHQITGGENVVEPAESIMDIIDPYGILDDVPDSPTEDCDQADPEKGCISNETLTPMRETKPEADSIAWEPKWAALQMEQDATTTVEVEEPEVLVSEVYRRTEENSESEPAIAVQSPVDPNTLNSHQLRNLCKELGIRWRNVKGQGKHMTRLEMLNALGRAIA